MKRGKKSFSQGEKREKYVSKDRDSIGMEGGQLVQYDDGRRKRKRDFVFFSLYDIGFDILIAFPVIKNDTASAKYVL